MPAKIGFSVVSCTGEDERYRVTELNYHGPTVKGWRSQKDCSYPQEIILQLANISKVEKVQILAHQYLIPQKVELWLSEGTDCDLSLSPCIPQTFEYLGFITLSDNKSTKYKSRELKSVTVPPCLATFLKLKLHANHINEKNVYSQIGIVAVNVLGEELDNSEYGSMSQKFTSQYDDLAFEMYVDKEIAEIMRTIEMKKHQAVAEERFEYASKLKSALEDLREAGETLGKYEQEKYQAINLEDYDKAKGKKQQIDLYREQIYEVLNIKQLLELDGRDSDNDLSITTNKSRRRKSLEPPSLSSVEQQTTSPHHHQTSAPWDYYPTSRPSYKTKQEYRPMTPNQLNHSQSQIFHRPPTNSPPFTSSTSNPQLCNYSMEPPQYFRQSSTQDSYSMCQPAGVLSIQTPQYDMYYSMPTHVSMPTPQYERSVSADRRNVDFKMPDSIDNFRPTTPTPRSPTDRSHSLRGSLKRRNKSAGGSKTSYEAYEERALPSLKTNYHGNEIVRECQLATEQLRKSKLNEREKKQAALSIQIFGIELVEKFHSKHFVEKEEALRQLKEELKLRIETIDGQNTQSPNKIARAVIFLLHRALRDTVYSVYSSAADVIRFFFSDFVPGRVSSAEVARSVEKLLPELIAKSGDATPRIHNMAAHTLLSMADCKEVRDLHIIPVHLTRPLTSSVHPRLALSRLEMVEQLILSHGISTEKQSGLTCRVLSEFGSFGLHHPAEAVRKVSERILIQVYKVNPRLVRKQLPPDDDITRRNLLYRQLFQEFDFMDLQRKKEQDQILQQQQPQQYHHTKHTTNRNNEQPTSNHKQEGEENKQKIQENVISLLQKTKSNIEPEKHKAQHVKLEKLIDKMNRISEERTDQEINDSHGEMKRKLCPKHEKKAEDALKFPNLVDSVTLSENRFAQQRRNLKTLKYIFPTSYIGTTTPSGTSSGKPNDTAGNTGIPQPVTQTKTSLAALIPMQRLMKNLSKKDEKNSISTSKSESNITKKNERKEEEVKKDGETGSSSSTSVITSPSEVEKTLAELKEEEGQTYKMCIFCFTREDWFTEESLNIHYWKECPMLTRCIFCKEVIEIPGLIQHRLEECKEKGLFQKCNVCLEAILKEQFDVHQCRINENKTNKTRCPLCHEDIGEADEAWKNHLMGQNPCLKNPRRKIKAKKSPTQRKEFPEPNNGIEEADESPNQEA